LQSRSRVSEIRLAPDAAIHPRQPESLPGGKARHSGSCFDNAYPTTEITENTEDDRIVLTHSAITTLRRNGSSFQDIELNR